MRSLVYAEATGFYPPETINGRIYNWTDGHATIKCSLPQKKKLKWMWVELAPGPSSNTVQVSFNGTCVLNRNLNSRQRLRIPLPVQSASNQFTIHIDSGVFVPAAVLASTSDRRRLGVLVGEIRVAKYWWRLMNTEHLLNKLGKLKALAWRPRTA